MRTAIALAVLATAWATSACATGEIQNLMTAADKTRLEKFDETRAEALAEARQGGARDDVTLIGEIEARPSLPFAGFDMAGDWQCRTIKLGGPAPLVVYGWFRCRVTDDGAGWQLTKLSGSQRTTGRFFDETGTSLTYIGSYYVAGDRPPRYGSGPASDQVGRAYRSGRDRWRIEFPLPTYESKFDILEFRR